MNDLKSFSVGHTAKGAIWWQAWPFDGEPRKGTAGSIVEALDAIGIAAPTTAEVAAVSREYSDLCAERADDREQVSKALAAKDAEIARLTAEVADLQAANLRLGVKVSAMVGAIDRLEAALPDTYDPAPDAPAKGPASPAKPRKVANGPDGTAPEVAAYLRQVRGVQ
jgi:hypothetical protein